MTTGAEPPPVLRVVRGCPDATEIAALVSVLAARAAGIETATTTSAASGRPPARSGWADRHRLLRTAPPPGPGGWRASARPG